MSGVAAAGALSLGLALERLVNAILVDGIASYLSARVIVAAACATTGVALLVVSAIRARSIRSSCRPTRFGGPR